MRRTKIVCTLGPASCSKVMVERLVRAGMNVARINFSHGSYEEHEKTIAIVKKVASDLNRPLAILQDLSGPKIRLGRFDTPFMLKPGQIVGFVCAEHLSEIKNLIKEKDTGIAEENLILPLPVPSLLEALKPRCSLLLDDGKILCRVTRCADGVVWAKCIVGGELKPRKGVTAPGVLLHLPSVTEKDLADLRFGLAQGVDWVAASYVRRATDLDPLRAVLKELGAEDTPLIAKIENQEAVDNFAEILKVVQGIMVARGDMGVEMPFERVPLVQKQIIRRCNRAGKPVITATQMLESMMTNPRPTRAEATDVTNAILDGSDAVMLSGETAAGEFPLQAVKTMARIAVTAEQALYRDEQYDTRLRAKADVTEAVARAVAALAEQINAKAILCATTSGGTARAVAQHRPNVPIFAVTSEPTTYRRLSLTWGVMPSLMESVNDTDAMMEATIVHAQQCKFIQGGDTVVLTAGVPVNNPGTTNLIRIHRVGQPLTTGTLPDSLG